MCYERSRVPASNGAGITALVNATLKMGFRVGRAAPTPRSLGHRSMQAACGATDANRSVAREAAANTSVSGAPSIQAFREHCCQPPVCPPSKRIVTTVSAPTGAMSVFTTHCAAGVVASSRGGH